MKKTCVTRIMRAPLVVTVSGILLVCFLLLGRIAEYLLSEFVYCRHGYTKTCSQCLDNEDLNSTRQGTIPKHLHQIFFFETDSVLPKKFQKAQLSWQRHHPDYGYTLWNKTSIRDLIQRKYPHLEAMYDSYGHWVRRADVARYLVMHQYGGWYIDIDINCKNGLQNLSAVARHNSKSLVVRWTEPAGCSNDFIGVTPRHPFFLHVLYGLAQANKWYIFPYATTMFSTGPMFMWGRMKNYPRAEEETFWVFDHSQYFDLMHGSSWHSWDGKIVWYFFNHDAQFWNSLIVVTSLFVSMVTLVLLWRRRRRRMVSKDISFDRTEKRCLE